MRKTSKVDRFVGRFGIFLSSLLLLPLLLVDVPPGGKIAFYFVFERQPDRGL